MSERERERSKGLLGRKKNPSKVSFIVDFYSTNSQGSAGVQGSVRAVPAKLSTEREDSLQGHYAGRGRRRGREQDALGWSGEEESHSNQIWNTPTSHGRQTRERERERVLQDQRESFMKALKSMFLTNTEVKSTYNNTK